MISLQKVEKKRSIPPIFKLKTYISLTGALSDVKEKQNELYIFGTAALANWVQKAHNIHSFSIDGVARRLFPKFHSAKTDIYLQSQLRKYILKGEFKYEKYLLNRLPAIVHSFRVFAEFSKNIIAEENRDARNIEIVQLINLLLSENLLSEYHLTKQSLTKEEISELICGHPYLTTLYFYEIDYLNFYRMNFIHWLKSKGFDIEFHIPYQVKNKKTFAFWRHVYSVAARVNFNDIITNVDSLDNFGSRFSQFNEGVLTHKPDREDIEVLEFASPLDFNTYFQNTKENVIAIDPSNVDQVVNLHTSSIYENKIGRFIYYIQFCERTENTVCLDFNILTELLTSGVVSTTDASGVKALSYLIDLRDYMQGTKSTREVIDRLKRLQELELVSRTFDRENAAEVGRNNLKRYMLNPFRSFSFLHQEKYEITINQLIDLVEKFEQICADLIIEEESSINVNVYFERWKEFIKKMDQTDESEFWNKVFSEQLPNEWEFAMKELLQLIYLIATTHHKRTVKVNDVSNLPALLFQVDKDEPLHLTNLTQHNFPEIHKTPISDFFDYTELKNFIINNVETKENRSVLLHALWVDYTVANQFESLGIYQIYTMIAKYKGRVKFSWIKHLEEDGIRSVYLDILADLYQDGNVKEWKPTMDISTDILFSELNKLDDTSNSDKKLMNIGNISGRIPDLYWLDHDFCAKKFYLTTFIEKQPIYSSDFHHQLIFAKIGRLFTHSSSDRAKFRELFYPLFPHWTYTKKENLIDMEYKAQLRNYKHFENISYPREMRGFQVLRSVYRENRRTKARNQYRKNNNSNEKDLIKQFQELIGRFEVKAEPGNHCRMCPHLRSCREGMYAIDNLSQ